jgi:hypothetical protein
MRVQYPNNKISHHSSRAINALGSVTQVRLYKSPNWPSLLHALSQDQTNSSSSSQDNLDTSHINANTHKNIGVSAKIEIADIIASIRTKWRFHITSTLKRPAPSDPANLTTYQNTSKEIKT